MVVTINLIIDTLLEMFGTIEIVGMIIIFISFITLLLMKLPFPAAVVMLLPMFYTLSRLAWIPNWVFAILLIIIGLILSWMIKQLYGR